MEKKESRGIIGTQLNPQKIIASWVNEKKVGSVFLGEMTTKAKTFENITFIPSKQFVMPSLIRPGMYGYADGLIYPKFIPEAQLQSVVGYANKKQILSWCLRSKVLRWSVKHFLVGEDKNLSGKEATRGIITKGSQLGIATPAADYCFNYAEDGVIPETTFLPSYKEGKLLLSGREAVNKALNLVGLPGLERYLLLSSECDYCLAWVFWRGGMTWDGKSSFGNYVRPVLDLSYLLK